MINKENSIHKYIDEKKEFQRLVLQIIEETDLNDDSVFQNLLNYLEIHQYSGNKQELNHFLHFILIISINHHRQNNFFQKIEKILIISSKFYKPSFSNIELFTIFQESKPILLSLFKAKIIMIDEIIFYKLLNFSESKGDEIYYYFYPELIQSIKSGCIQHTLNQHLELKLNENFEEFESNRQKGENDFNLCSIIREDLIADFVKYVNQTNIPLSCQIKHSIFETNSMLIEKVPSLIEYAFFFGSIQIIRYLVTEKVELTPSLWLYAVHSNNPEIIQFLEDKKIKIDDRAFSEAIKCHHNDIAYYIYNNYFDGLTNITDLSDDSFNTIFSSENYEFFPYEIDENRIFFILCQNNFIKLVDFYLKLKNKEIESYISQQKKSEIQLLIQKALKENKLDVAYHLLQKINNIPEKYFHNKKNITKIAIPPNILSIDNCAFYKCSSLKQISIPSSVTSIENNTFYFCSSLTQITIPSSVTSIGDYAFYFCGSLKQIIIPSFVTSIGNYAFSQCSSLTQITIPSSVTSIGKNIFQGCSSLTQISIPFSITSIGDNAFLGCSSLTQITIPSSVTSIGNYAFTGCSSLAQIKIPSSVTLIGEHAFLRCLSLTQIKIPSSVTSIGNYAFSCCTSLTQISIPSSISSFGDSVFIECPKSCKITFTPSSEERFKYFNNIFLLYKSNPKSEIFDTLLLSKSSNDSITIPQFINKIGGGAFYNCITLKQISIPTSVTSIGSTAFSGCTLLSTILIPSSVTSIGENAFYKCTSIKEVVIPSSITTIKDSTFSKCSSLTKIFIPSSVTSIEESAFSECISLTEISIPASVTSIGANAFWMCLKLKQVIFETQSSLHSILGCSFSGCSSLTQISIPSSVEIIESGAFAGCSSLKNITIPSSIDPSTIKIPLSTKLTFI